MSYLKKMCLKMVPTYFTHINLVGMISCGRHFFSVLIFRDLMAQSDVEKRKPDEINCLRIIVRYWLYIRLDQNFITW